MSFPSPPPANRPSVSPKEDSGLSVEQCRKLMGWHDRSDDEIAKFLTSLRGFLGRFLDEHYPID